MVAIERVSAVDEFLDEVATLEPHLEITIHEDGSLVEFEVKVVEVKVKRLDQLSWRVRVAETSEHELVGDATNARGECAHNVVGFGQKVDVNKKALEALSRVAFAWIARVLYGTVVID